MDIYVGCELYSAGPDAEGFDYVAEAFFVGAELEDITTVGRSMISEKSDGMMQSIGYCLTRGWCRVLRV